MKITRRPTPTVKIRNVLLGAKHPVVIQSMTDTPTADIKKTIKQIKELVFAGSQMVRITINDEKAMKAASTIISSLRDDGIEAPIIGDFHYNGHLLLSKFPAAAKLLDKIRINPGNIGKGRIHDENFAMFIQSAIDTNLAVRIGINWGSLDQELLTTLMNKNAKRKRPKTDKTVILEAMVQSACLSAQKAISLGLKESKCVLSAKMSSVRDTVDVNMLLAERCPYVLHIGLTEAGSNIQGIVSSAASLGTLLQKGIGDTIRISLTPQPGISRTREVEVCKTLLQSLELSFFAPTVTSCPGCGRTDRKDFQVLAEEVKKHIQKKIDVWKKIYPGIETLKIAVMGCVVNGPGESKHADIGISLPGSSEEPVCPVFIEGKKTHTLKGTNIQKQFIQILEKFLQKKYSSS